MYLIYGFVFQSSIYVKQKMRLHILYWKAPLFFVGNSGQATGKTHGRIGRREDQDTHKYSNNSSISSSLKSILCMLLFLISIISSMMDIFQTSDSSIWWYLIFRTSSGTRWWILALSVIKRMLRRLEPVTEFVSRRIESRRNFVAFFVEFLICWRKDKNRFTKTNLRCCTLLRGSINRLCVPSGRSSISLIDTFHVFSSWMASFEKRSHREEPEKWELYIEFIMIFVFGWEKPNSWRMSLFLEIKSALLIFRSAFIPSSFVSIFIPRCFPDFTQGRGFPQSFRVGSGRSLARKAKHFVLQKMWNIYKTSRNLHKLRMLFKISIAQLAFHN